jgi:hypothetical protein
MTSGVNINMASREWARRPDDERFLSLADLKAAVASRKTESWTVAPRVKDLRVLPEQNGDLSVQIYDPTVGDNRSLSPTNWSFNQLSQYAQAPAAYLRNLPAELAAINLQWGLEQRPIRDEALVLAQSNGSNLLRAMTGVGYGRIWDMEVVEAVERVNESGRWKIPSATYTATNPKRATTLYASDRDVFIFLVDDQNAIDINGELLYRGFITWNSEVGSAVFGLMTFLYRVVCDNRIIWDATEIKELRIRHTSGAPERFAHEGAKFLQRYAEEDTKQITESIKKAQQTDIPLAKDQTTEEWLQARGFTRPQAKASVETAKAEQGDDRTVWDIVNGITAYSRSIVHTNTRVELEKKAGALMRLAS